MKQVTVFKRAGAALLCLVLLACLLPGAAPAAKAEERVTSDVRDVILVLDTSGSMEGTPLRETKEAACSFIETVLQSGASIGVVSYDNYAEIRADFSMNEYDLKNTVNDLYVGGKTNTEDGLLKAEGMLLNSHAKKRIIVLMSDGRANKGRTGEELIAYANSLKEQGLIIYTLGFFEDLYGSNLTEAQDSMERIASPGCHFEVDEAENLRFFFDDVAGQVTGEKYIYIRIACPVDVEVSYGGETLSSLMNRNRCSFGTLTYEEGEESAWYGDNRTKILRLREGADYDIRINGNGEGTMNYTMGFMNGDNEYTDLREIKDVPITENTVIKGNSDRNKPTELYVDNDGDGKVDQTYSAGGPEQKTDLTFLIWIGLGVVVLAGAAVTLILLLKRKKRLAAGGAVPKAPKQPRQPASAYPQTPAAVKYGQPSRPAGGFCGSCGAPVDGKSPFCGNCGARL